MHRVRSLFLGFGMLGILVLGNVPAAFAGASVDPDTLTPPPPPGARCSADGRYVICSTS